MSKFKFMLVLSTLLALGLSTTSWAVPITCGSDEREATLDPALDCETGIRNPNGNSFFDGDWTDAGELTGDGTDDFLTVELTSGSWGSSPIVATWSIDPSFWLTYGSGVISVHVGNGNGDPDWWAWTIEAGALSGTFSYSDFDGIGGGLSNLRLWGRGAPTSVPEPGTLALLGLGLVVLAARRKKAL